MTNKSDHEFVNAKHTPSLVLMHDHPDLDNDFSRDLTSEWESTTASAESTPRNNFIPNLIPYLVQMTSSHWNAADETTDQLIVNQSLSINQTNREELVYYFYQTETLTFLWILLCMIIIGNSSVLITLFMSKNRKTRMNFFIMHLAIADLTVGLVSVGTDIAWKTTVGFYAGNVACKIIKFSQVLTTYSSTYVLVSLTIDRYDAITHPLNFTGSWRRARLLVVSSWGLSAIFSIPAIFLNEERVIEGRPQCWITLESWQWQIYIPLVAISLFFIPAIIITACYSIIVHTIWTKSKIMTFPKTTNKSKSNSGASESHQKDIRRESQKFNDIDFKRASSRGIIPKAKIKTVKMTFVIVFVFILCWSPYFVWGLLQVFGAIPQTQTTIAFSTFIQSLAPLNSAANPLIYYLFSTHFCRNLRKYRIFRYICCHTRSIRGSASKRTDYNTINSSQTQSSRTNTQHFSMTSKSSPKNSTIKKTVVIRDDCTTHIQKQYSDDAINSLNCQCSNSVL